MVANFIQGFFYFLMGFRLVREPALLRFVWIPLLCNILLFLLLLVFAAFGLNAFSHWIEGFLPYWLQWLHWVIWLLSLLFSGIILIYLSTMMVNLIAGPFNSLLSTKVIQFLQLPDQPSNVSTIQALPASLVRQVKFIAYYLPRAILYLILFLIPVVQIVAAVVWFFFNGWVFTMQYLDYPMDNHGVSIKQMRKLMAAKPELCLGFGCAVVLFAMIPLVNFIIVPVAVVGATVLWAKEYFPNPGHLADPSIESPVKI